MGCSSIGSGINLFALVAYIPDPLGGFLDRLRAELVPGCVSRSHVTILPPRPLEHSDAAVDQILGSISDRQPFTVKLGEIEIFPATQVVYLSVSEGTGKLAELHSELNLKNLSFNENFEYHPHVTLAQDLPAGTGSAAAALARQRWAAYPYTRNFQVTELHFVQNAGIGDRKGGTWVDLVQCRLK